MMTPEQNWDAHRAGVRDRMAAFLDPARGLNAAELAETFGLLRHPHVHRFNAPQDGGTAWVRVAGPRDRWGRLGAPRLTTRMHLTSPDAFRAWILEEFGLTLPDGWETMDPYAAMVAGRMLSMSATDDK